MYHFLFLIYKNQLMNKNLTIKTTYHLLKKDPLSLIRRLPIIMIEDSALLDQIKTYLVNGLFHQQNIKSRDIC